MRAKSARREEPPKDDEEPEEPAPKRARTPEAPPPRCRLPSDISPSLDLRRTLLRSAENKFVLYSSEGRSKTATRIIAQIFNKTDRKATGFNAELKNKYDKWGPRTSPKFPKKSNEDALLLVYKQWFTIYLSKIKTQWLQSQLPYDKVEKLEDIEDIIVLLSRKTFDSSISSMLYVDGAKGQVRTKDAATARFQAAYKVSN
jgi:hypothetical protein